MEPGISECTFVNNLITAVQETKCLYHKKDPSYYNRLVKEKAWKAIGEKCNRTSAECKHKWKAIREKYARELRKIEFSSEIRSAPIDEQDQWAYFQDLTFLRSSMRPRGNRVMEGSTITEGSNSPFASVDYSDLEEPYPNTSSSSTPMPPKRGNISSETLSKRPREMVIKTEQSEVDTSAGESTTDELFAKTIVSLMQGLPLSVKDKFQLDVYQHIYQLRAEMRGD